MYLFVYIRRRSRGRSKQQNNALTNLTSSPHTNTRTNDYELNEGMPLPSEANAPIYAVPQRSSNDTSIVENDLYATGQEIATTSVPGTTEFVDNELYAAAY